MGCQNSDYHHVVHSEFFPVPTAHEDWIRNRVPRGTHYDPADDGPEVQIITCVLVGLVREAVAGWISVKPTIRGWDLGSMDFIAYGRE